MVPTLAMLIAAIACSLLVVEGSRADDGDAQILVQGLQNKDCEARSAAIATYYKSTDNQKEQNAGLRNLRISDPDLREQISSLISIREDDREGVARISALAEQISTIESLSPSDQQLKLRGYRDVLLKLVRNKDERFAARVGVPWVLTRVLRAGDKDNPNWIAGWRKESLEMRGRETTHFASSLP